MSLDVEKVRKAIDKATSRKKDEGKDSKFHYHTVDEINDELEVGYGDSEVEEFLEENSDSFVKDIDNKEINKYRKKFP